MARAKKTTPEWSADALAGFFISQVNAQAAGKGFLVSSDEASSDVGIRLPNFVLRYLYHRTTLPFERTTILYGPTGSNKSSFLFWLYWLFRTGGGAWTTPHGKYYHLGVEDKDSPILRLSLTDYDDDAGWVTECESMDHFQEQVRAFLAWFKGVMEKGPGRRVPLIIGIDSLVAKMTASAESVVDKAGGVTGKRYADEARSLTDWYKYIPSKLRGWPIHLVGVNHDKPKPGANGMPDTHHTPGGSAPNYNATYKLLLQRVKKLPESAAGWQGNRIRFKMEKNSLGSDSYTVEANVIWRPVQRPNAKGDLVMAQQTLWDWHRATTELLYLMKEDREKRPSTSKAVRDILGIDRVTGGRYIAPAIGVTKDDPLSAYDFSVHLESQTEVLRALEERLGIYQGQVHREGVDLLEQHEEAKQRTVDSMPAAGGTVVAYGEEAPVEGEAEDDA